MERSENIPDEFVVYRMLFPDQWNKIEPQLKKCFDGKIPEDIEPHLRELVAVRVKRQGGGIERDEMIGIILRYSEIHNQLFNNDLFNCATRMITAKFPLAI